MHEAQKAYHYGFGEHDALKAVTSIPAAALGLDYRIGRWVTINTIIIHTYPDTDALCVVVTALNWVKTLIL